MNKTFLALGVVGVLTYSVPAMPVKAINNGGIRTAMKYSHMRQDL